VKIAYIAAGAGGMYCGSCMRDNALATALLKLGHPTTLVPTYTPLKTDEENVSIRKVFYGGIGVYLAQTFGVLRRPIPFLDRLLSNRLVLKAVSSFSFATDPAVLGELTLSVLRGEDGHQKKSLEELVEFLEWSVRPDLVHLTNSLFAGMAPVLKRRLGVPVVSSFQGEDLFLEGLPDRHRQSAVELIREASEAIDLFLAVSGYTADFMSGYLGIPRSRIRVVMPGIRLDGYPAPGEPRPASARPFTVGYLARIAPEKGLTVLAEAYRILRQGATPGANGASAPARLRAAGYLGSAGRLYLASVRRRLEEWGLAGEFEYAGEVDRDEKLKFLREVDVFSVPSTYPEAMGLFAFEAMASGTPVVLPATGAFPEIVQATGGGLLVDPGDPSALAAGLRKLMDEPVLRGDLGRRGAEAVRQRFHPEAMARATLAAYGEIAPVKRA
jgi:glycosyltransferase involved in cell wall biosynthesis